MVQHSKDSGQLTHTVMGAKGPIDDAKQALGKSEFLGYDATSSEAQLLCIIGDAQQQSSWDRTGEENPALVILDRTPFYGESGGQVGDSGRISTGDFVFRVTDTQKDSALLLHYGYLESGTMHQGIAVHATVDVDRRQAIQRAHSATHILHHALQKELGEHAQQQGSKVDDDWLRFDFTNLAPVDESQLTAIQSDVDQRILEAAEIRWETLPLATAKEAGAMMLFGEKYPDPVRMVSMGDFSKELCGGTHLTNTNQVGRFELLSEEGVSAGTRRVVAITGQKAEDHVAQSIQGLPTSCCNAKRLHLAAGIRSEPAIGGKPRAQKTARWR